MTTNYYDLSLEYLGGVTKPTADQDGYLTRVRVDPVTGAIGWEYIGAQTITGSGSWDLVAETIIVLGSGARTITLADGRALGQRVYILDGAASAGTGTITVVTSNGSGSITGVTGASAIAVNNDTRVYAYIGSGKWLRVAG